VDVTGIEPVTPCLQSQSENSILLFPLVSCCTVMRGFSPYFRLNGLQSDSTWSAFVTR
jgi:hypothetical protein